MTTTTDNAPGLSTTQLDELTYTGNEPMISRQNMTRIGKVQRRFMAFLNAGDSGERTMLAAWQWVNEYHGYDGWAKKWRDQTNQWTNAGLAKLLHALKRRGLLIVVRDEQGFGHIRSRVPSMSFEDIEHVAD